MLGGGGGVQVNVGGVQNMLGGGGGGGGGARMKLGGAHPPRKSASDGDFSRKPPNFVLQIESWYLGIFFISLFYQMKPCVSKQRNKAAKNVRKCYRQYYSCEVQLLLA